MTKEEYLKIPESNRETLDKALGILIKFMAPKIEQEKYRERLMNRIPSYYCSSTHPKEVADVIHDKGYFGGGTFPTLYSKKVKANSIKDKYFIITKDTIINSHIFINDIVIKSKFCKLWTVLHELNHADTNTYAYIDYINRLVYTGFEKIKLSYFGKHKVIGKGLNEFINELYTQIQLYEEKPKAFKNIKSIDELIYSFTQKYGPEEYNKLGYILRLFLIACDNDLTVSYDSLKDNDEIFAKKTVKLNNGKKWFKNDLMYYGKYNARSFERKFNKLLGNGTYDKLLRLFDELLYDINMDDPFTNETIAKIIEIIDGYKTKKYNLMESQGLWSKEKREYHERIYSNYREYVANIGYSLPRKDKEEIKKVYKLINEDEKKAVK